MNRRVAVLLLKSNKNFPIQYPCKQGDIGPCKKQAGRKGVRRTDGFKCFFYDALVAEVETPPPAAEKAIVDLDYACRVCGKYDKAVGALFLKNWSNLFFIGDVDALTLWPKTLLFANCCLTAITDAYPKAWNAKGTRWYIGWGLPVGDADAVSCAKAFYKRWLEHYEMDPAKVQDAFNDVKAPYAKYRPRIHGA